MDKFLQQMQNDLESKIIASVKGESIIKPFSQVYERAIEKKVEQHTKELNGKYIGNIYLGEDSIYTEILSEYLKNNPDFFDDLK